VKAGLWALAFALGVVGCVGAPCQPLPGELFVLIGKNPFAAAQPTSLGRRLHTLEGWRHELYMGYGDYDENTGPIEVSIYNPRHRIFASKLSFDTEAIEIYRRIGERLYAPAIDPVGSGQSASVAIGESDGRWWNNKAVFMTHAFDIATLDGTDLWLVGSQGSKAVVVRSSDGGTTWVLALTLAPVGGDPEDFARFYFIFAHEGRLYVQGEDRLGGTQPRSKVLSSVGWMDGPDLQALRGSASKPVAFGDKIVYRGRQGLVVFDGQTARTVQTEALDLTVVGSTLYVLDAGVIRGTRDLKRWIDVAPTPTEATSIGVLDGVLYVGTARSELYRYCKILR
jgi:hypothetical protein